MVKKKELQEKLILYQLLKARLESLNNQRNILLSKLLETDRTLESLNYIQDKEGKTIFPIGSGIYLRTSGYEKGRVIVDIGANVLLEKDLKDAKEILERRRKELEKFLVEISNTMLSLSSKLEETSKEIQRMAKENVQNTKG